MTAGTCVLAELVEGGGCRLADTMAVAVLSHASPATSTCRSLLVFVFPQVAFLVSCILMKSFPVHLSDSSLCSSLPITPLSTVFALRDCPRVTEDICKNNFFLPVISLKQFKQFKEFKPFIKKERYKGVMTKADI